MKLGSVITIVNLPSPPGVASIGDLYFDTTLQSLQSYTASGWQSAGSGVVPAPSIDAFINFS